jgi:hypothetical protein
VTQTVELARFRVKPEEEQAFLAERAAMRRAALENFDGLVDEALVRLEDGSYVSIWTWQDRSSCDSAMSQVDQIAAVRSWLGHMEEDISMEFGALIDPPESPAR